MCCSKNKERRGCCSSRRNRKLDGKPSIEIVMQQQQRQVRSTPIMTLPTVAYSSNTTEMTEKNTGTATTPMTSRSASIIAPPPSYERATEASTPATAPATPLEASTSLRAGSDVGFVRIGDHENAHGAAGDSDGARVAATDAADAASPPTVRLELSGHDVDRILRALEAPPVTMSAGSHVGSGNRAGVRTAMSGWFRRS